MEVQNVSNGSVSGYVIVIHKPVGSIDVYYDEHLKLPDDWVQYDPAFTGLPVTRTHAMDLSATICEVSELDNHVDASFTDLDGYLISCHLRFGTRVESGPLAIPSTQHNHTVHCRFFLINRFRLVDSRTAQISVRVDDREVALRPLSRFLPKYRLSARTGGDLLLGGLGSPRSQNLAIAPPIDFDVGGGTTSFSFRYVEETRGSVGSVGGAFVVNSSIGEVATGRWVWRQNETECELAITSLVQDWRAPGWSPTRRLLQWARRFKRRAESWRYTFKARQALGEWHKETGGWSK